MAKRSIPFSRGSGTWCLCGPSAPTRSSRFEESYPRDNHMSWSRTCRGSTHQVGECAVWEGRAGEIKKLSPVAQRKSGHGGVRCGVQPRKCQTRGPCWGAYVWWETLCWAGTKDSPHRFFLTKNMLFPIGLHITVSLVSCIQRGCGEGF